MDGGTESKWVITTTMTGSASMLSTAHLLIGCNNHKHDLWYHLALAPKTHCPATSLPYMGMATPPHYVCTHLNVPLDEISAMWVVMVTVVMVSLL